MSDQQPSYLIATLKHDADLRQIIPLLMQQCTEVTVSVDPESSFQVRNIKLAQFKTSTGASSAKSQTTTSAVTSSTSSLEGETPSTVFPPSSPHDLTWKTKCFDHVLEWTEIIDILVSDRLQPVFTEQIYFQGHDWNYDHFERPVGNASAPLDVRVRFLLNQILDVDEKNQVVTILAYVDYRWSDYKLQWDPAHFGGLKDVRFWGSDDAPFKLWKPDILLFNSVSASFDSTYSSRIIVYNDGTVQQNPPGILRFSCDLDVTYFPFDTQACFLKFGSWTYSGSHIDLDMIVDNIIGVHGHRINVKRVRETEKSPSYFVNESMDLQVYITSGEFDLIDTPGKRVVTFFDKESYHELYYYIRFRRKTLAYGINLIVPSLVITVMTVLGFTLPPEACEKVTLETTVLLSVLFFLQMLANMSPPQSRAIPILAVFFCCCLLVVSCSVVFTVLVLSMQHKKPETHAMSPMLPTPNMWDVCTMQSLETREAVYVFMYMRFKIRNVFLNWLPYILLMKRPEHPKTPKPVIAHSVAATAAISQIPLLSLPRPSNTMVPIPHSPSILHSKGTVRECIHYFDVFSGQLKKINSDLEKVTNKLDEDFKRELLRSEWKFAAMALDRACLFLFTIFITISACAIILPHILKNL